MNLLMSKLKIGETPNGVLVKNRKSQLRQTLIIGGILYLILLLIVLHASAYMAFDYQMSIYEALSKALTALQTHPFQFVAIPTGCAQYILLMTTLYALAVLYVWAGYKKDMHMMGDASYGTAHWNTDLQSYNKRFTDPAGTVSKDGNKNTILTEDVYMSMDGHKTRRNINVFLIGGSGAGKSRFYIKPNLCQMPLNTSFVTTDPSGELLESCGQMLEDFGYKIKVLNLVNMKKSNTYNPLNYIHEENDVILLADCLLKNTADAQKTGGDDFWEKAMKLMLQAFIFALWLHGDEIGLTRTFDSVMTLMRGCTIEEEGTCSSDTISDTDKLFNLIEFGYMEKDGKIIAGTKATVGNPAYKHAYGEDIAVRQYKNFKMGAGKTLKNILISAMARFSNFDSQQLIDLTSGNDIDLTMIGREKTALFVILPQEHDSFNFLAATMYSQLAQSLYFDAENKCQGNYLVTDADGEIAKIFEIDHSAEIEEAISRKAPEEELVINFENEIIDSNKQEKKAAKKINNIFKKLFKKKPISQNESDEAEAEENEKNTLPIEDAGGRKDEDVKALASQFVEDLKNCRLVQRGKKYVIKAKIGDIEEDIAEYGNREYAIRKAKALRNCSVKQGGLCLPFNVRMLLDEFANIGEIPRFTNLLATMRKYNISAACVLQSLSQIKKMYKDDWGSIIGNCDALLFLGCGEYETQEYISKKLGKTTIRVRNNSISNGGKSGSSMSYQYVARDLLSPDEVGQLSDNESILLIRGVPPFRGNKYEYTNHPNYKYTADADPNRAYKIKIKAKDISKADVTLNAPVISFSETEEGKLLSESQRAKSTRSRRPQNRKNNMESISDTISQKKSDSKMSEIGANMFADSARFTKQEYEKAKKSCSAPRPAKMEDIESIFKESTKVDAKDFLFGLTESFLPEEEEKVIASKAISDSSVFTPDKENEKIESPVERGSIDAMEDSLSASSSTATL